MMGYGGIFLIGFVCFLLGGLFRAGFKHARLEGERRLAIEALDNMRVAHSNAVRTMESLNQMVTAQNDSIKVAHEYRLATSDLQRRVYLWALDCLGEEQMRDRRVRATRVLEEAIELAQAEGVTFQEALRWAVFIYDRPVGNPRQELGGVAITLLAYGSTVNLDVLAESGRELARISTPARVEKIRARQAEKAKVIDMGPGGARREARIDDGMCRSCVDGRCTTGPDCVTLSNPTGHSTDEVYKS